MSDYEYKREKYDFVAFRVKKGGKAQLQARAADLGMSLAGFLTAAAENFNGWGDEFIARHSGEIAETNTVGEKIPIEDKAEHLPQQITDEELKLLTIFKSLPPKTQKNLLKFLESLQD